MERAGEEPLLSTGLFRNRVSNLGLVTQNVQWLLLMGTAFVVSAYLQVVRGYNAIQTGVIFTAATGGILVSSLAAERLAKKHAQRTLIIAGFVTTIVGIVVLLALVNGSPSAWAFAPGLLLIGLGVGVMLTPSVNVVQSAFPEERQGEISGLSRCISNLGSSLGTAVAGHHPRVQPHEELVCRRDDRPGTHRDHRARRGDEASRAARSAPIAADLFTVQPWRGERASAAASAESSSSDRPRCTSAFLDAKRDRSAVTVVAAPWLTRPAMRKPGQ